MLDKITLHNIQASPVTLISQVNLNEVMVLNMCMIADKLNELILILNSDSINEAKRRGRPSKNIQEEVV